MKDDKLIKDYLGDMEILKAPNGKTFKRKVGNVLMGDVLFLGETIDQDGKRRIEGPEDFEIIDEKPDLPLGSIIED
jgi:hypothetical protein